MILSDLERYAKGLPEYVKFREIMMIFEVGDLSPDILFDHGTYSEGQNRSNVC